jgi:hypothetical protein
MDAVPGRHYGGSRWVAFEGPVSSGGETGREGDFFRILALFFEKWPPPKLIFKIWPFSITPVHLARLMKQSHHMHWSDYRVASVLCLYDTMQPQSRQLN